MNRSRAVKSLAALAQDTRLDAFRLLVQAGPEGLAAGELAARLDISPPALSFHLRGLAHAGLVRAQQDGRFIYYSADFDAMQSLLGFLTENCCNGAACTPARATGRRSSARRTS
ncbi:MAG: metalloregulator ArsR/SmtB family transcription factor [Gammaproteobacteria bacterium]|nr:metalloregulator ArsR/SmtB family transcription factor [Gammaproteobacteria bacterium]